jgi:pyridoxamine 5'-phosphate oxidase
MIQNKVNHKIPFEIFEKWFIEASLNSKIIEPSAMCLATSTLDNKPSARMVLLKKFDERGFCFYTNLTSRKGQELKNNLSVALCFYWGVLGRQVRIEGEVESVSQIEADEYFASRRRESRIGAWASKQSQKMENWQEFENRITEISNQFENQEIPRPVFWSGFRVKPQKIEFWEEGDFRIHRRHLYEKAVDGWIVNEIYP